MRGEMGGAQEKRRGELETAEKRETERRYRKSRERIDRDTRREKVIQREERTQDWDGD